MPSYIDMQHKVATIDASDIPMLTWPDGTWCFPANVYILKLYQSGHSRKNKGGTLLTYATNISHLLRYAFNNKIELVDLTDNQFSLFIRTLQGEKRASKPTVFARNANTVIAIGRNCLDFLATIGNLYQNENFIGPKGQIRAEKREYAIRGVGRRNTASKYAQHCWYHRAFPTTDPKIKRYPISGENVEKIRNVIQSSSKTLYQRKRRYVMLKLLEITGARRYEIASLTCSSVIEASSMAAPLLKLMTVKKRTGKVEYRYIPIARHDLAELIEFILVNRKRIIRLTCGSHSDDDRLLISETTGHGLRPNTITQEIAFLVKEAGIQEKACAHMFRHRFITKIFVALIKQHEFENTDSFRRALLDTETLKQKVLEWTGHSNLASLDVYIDLAFDEVANFSATFSTVNTKRITESLKTSIKQLQADLSDEPNIPEIIDRLNSLLTAYLDDLNLNLEQ